MVLRSSPVATRNAAMRGSTAVVQRGTVFRLGILGSVSLGVLLLLALTTARSAETATPVDSRLARGDCARPDGAGVHAGWPAARHDSVGPLRMVKRLAPAGPASISRHPLHGQERGLLGVAVDPSFASNGFVYLYYTRNKTGTCVNRVSRFTMSGDDDRAGDRARAHRQHPLAERQPQRRRPPVRQGRPPLRERRRRRLRLRGDSGCYGAERRRHATSTCCSARSCGSRATGGIPPTNPFQGAGTARCNVTGRTTAGNKCQETFAWGLRNPFRIAFDPNTTGTRFFINDVGESLWEEIDEGAGRRRLRLERARGPLCDGSRRTAARRRRA